MLPSVGRAPAAKAASRAAAGVAAAPRSIAPDRPSVPHVWHGKKQALAKAPTRTAWWNDMKIELSDEEQAVLQEHPIEEFGELIASAQDAYLSASEQDRPAADHRYLMLLNLAPKVIPFHPPEPEPEQLEQQRQFQRVLPAEVAKTARLAPEAQRAHLDQFKEDFFNRPTHVHRH
jgi:hypothetical protein